MRSTVVPAQITTVEDRITSHLGLSQLLLLTVPVFGGSAIFVILPPFFSYAVYKVMLIAAFAFLCGLLAIRIKGRILLSWAIAMLRYNTRPRYYVFNKNSAYKRTTYKVPLQDSADQQTVKKKPKPALSPQISTAQLVHIESIMSNPQAQLHFKTNRKGELRGYITEIQS